MVDPSFRALYARLHPEVDKRMIGLANGSAKRSADGSAGQSTAEAYAEQVGYIGALMDVIKLCVELDHERYGRKPTQQE